MPEPRIYAVITARYPLDVPAEASKRDKLRAATELVNAKDLYLEDGFTVTVEEMT